MNLTRLLADLDGSKVDWNGRWLGRPQGFAEMTPLVVATKLCTLRVFQGSESW